MIDNTQFTIPGWIKKKPDKPYEEKTDNSSTSGYSYWRTKRKLRVGLEVEGSSGGGVKVGNWTRNSTWTLSVTGVWFKPSSLRIVASIVGISWGVSDWVTDWNTSRSVNWFNNPTSPAVETTANLVYANWSGSGTTVANLVSFDSDGFTLNFTSIGPSVSFFYEARK